MTVLSDDCDELTAIQARDGSMSLIARILARKLEWLTCSCGRIFDARRDILAGSIEELADLLIGVEAISGSGAILWSGSSTGGAGVGPDPEANLAQYLRVVRDASGID